MAGGLLTRRAVLLADVEDTYGTEKTLGTDDGFLIAEPDFSPDISVLQRDIVRASLSTTAHVVGRKLSRMRFRTELRGNGAQHSGSGSDAPLIARLLRACGYSQTAMAAKSATDMYRVGLHTRPVAWTVNDGSLTNTDVVAYHLEVTTGGPSATAEITVTSDTAGESNAAAVVTTATPFTIGASGLTATPVFTGNLVQGQKWVIWILPTGIRMDPVSTGFESLTMKMFFDGTVHKMTGALGTFSVNAEAGQFGTIDWEFLGIWSNVADDTLPTPVYETALPPQVEFARLRVGTYAAIVNAMTFAQNNDLQPRPDVNAGEGYRGIRITGRNPEGGIDPEAELVANNDFWGQLASAARVPFQMRVGTVAGNTVWFLAPGVQYSGLTYRDRNGLRTYDAGLRFPAVENDDELSILFV